MVWKWSVIFPILKALLSDFLESLTWWKSVQIPQTYLKLKDYLSRDVLRASSQASCKCKVCWRDWKKGNRLKLESQKGPVSLSFLCLPSLLSLCDSCPGLSLSREPPLAISLPTARSLNVIGQRFEASPENSRIWPEFRSMSSAWWFLNWCQLQNLRAHLFYLFCNFIDLLTTFSLASEILQTSF